MLQKEIYTRAEAAEFLGLKKNTLAVWATTKRYKLPYVKIGSRAMYTKQDLETFIEHNKIEMKEFDGGLHV